VPRHQSGEAQVVRCISLLVALARSKRGINLRNFASRRGWNPRALYRDVQTLCDAGVPVEHPEQGWYRVADSWIPAGTVDIQRDELIALFVARHLAPGLKDTNVGQSLDRLWSKLSTPGHQPSLALGDETWLQARGPAAIDYGPHRIVLDTVHEAIRTRRALEIHYRKSSGEESRRTIEPAVVRWDPIAEALYTAAWCRRREDSRVFAIHRIVDARLTEDLFAPRREVVAEMNKAFRLWPRRNAERVILRFSPRVAGEVRERRWHTTDRWSEADDGGVILEMEVAAPDELERWLLGYGADVIVEAPASLAERIRDRHAEAAEAADNAAPARLGLLRGGRARAAATATSRRRGRTDV